MTMNSGVATDPQVNPGPGPFTRTTPGDRACAHVWSYRLAGPCWRVWTCKACGASREVDSSG